MTNFTEPSPLSQHRSIHPPTFPVFLSPTQIHCPFEKKGEKGTKAILTLYSSLLILILLRGNSRHVGHNHSPFGSLLTPTQSQWNHW